MGLEKKRGENGQMKIEEMSKVKTEVQNEEISDQVKVEEQDEKWETFWRINLANFWRGD